MKKLFCLMIAIGAIFFVFTITSLGVANAGRGCCSWHGGQNYCDTSTGRWVCNDGSYSPTCTCQYTPPKPKYTYENKITTEVIPFTSTEEPDANLEIGKKSTKQVGVTGTKEITIKITYKDGVEVSKEQISEKVTVEPFQEIISIGTKEPVKKGKVLGESTKKKNNTNYSWIYVLLITGGFVTFLYYLSRKR